MTGRDLRLVPVAAAVWTTALLCVFFPALAWWAAGACGVAGVGMVVRMSPRQGTGAERARGGLAAIVLLACAAAAMTAGFAIPDRSEVAALGNRAVEVVADVTSSSSVGSDGRVWFDAQTIRAGPPGSLKALAAPVRIGVEPLPGGGLDLGARIQVAGQAMATDGGERAALVVFGTGVEVVVPAQGVFGIAAEVRRDFLARAIQLPEPGAGLLPGLAVGDTSAVSGDLNDAMIISGLSHLTAVSGANCAIVVGAVFVIVALCGGGRTLRVVLALTALAAFVVLVTPEPSVIRAATMAGLAMLSVVLGRPSAGVGVLSLAATGILLADPWLAATPGFALSAAATAALIMLAPPLARGMQRWMPAPLALAIAIPLAAQLACGPIIALFAEQQSLVGVAANLLAAPAAPIATVVGLLACLAAPIPWLADFFAASAWLPAAWISATATTTAALPGAQVLVVPGIGMALVVAVLSVAVGVLFYRSRDGSPPSALVLRSASFVLAVAIVLIGSRALLAGPLVTATVPEGWSIAACDVGQGDAVLIRSAGQVALIDTGPEPAPVDECLRALGIDQLDLLVITHYDLDHVGGVDAVIGRVQNVLHGPPASEEDERTLADLEQHGAVLVEAAAGMQGTLGNAEWRVLWPRRDAAAFPGGNDASVVLAFAGGEVPSSIFLGDLSAVPQRLLAADARLGGPYTVVKVAHHGSGDQDARLYELLRPTVALFTVGENSYGHPRSDALALLEATGARLFRTDLHGRILLEQQEGEMRVWTEHVAEEVDAERDDPD